jgi:hypothetical protein
MQAPIKCKNDYLLVIPFKHVPNVMGFVNCIETTNYGQYLRKIAIKLKK